MHKRLRNLTKIARKFDRTVSMTRGGHYRLDHDAFDPIVTPATPSCHRSMKRLISDPRRAQPEYRNAV